MKAFMLISLVFLILIPAIFASAAEINLNQFQATYSLEHDNYPYLHFNYQTVGCYVLLKIYKENNDNFSYRLLTPNSYDKTNGDSFYFCCTCSGETPNCSRCKFDVFLSENPFDMSNLPNPSYEGTWIEFGE